MDLVQGELSREVFFNLTYQDITTEGNHVSEQCISGIHRIDLIIACSL